MAGDREDSEPLWKKGQAGGIDSNYGTVRSQRLLAIPEIRYEEGPPILAPSRRTVFNSLECATFRFGE